MTEIQNPLKLEESYGNCKYGCWPLKKDKGYFTWTVLNDGIALKAFSYASVLPPLGNIRGFNASYSSAPFQMVLYGYKDIYSLLSASSGIGRSKEGKIKLATMTFEGQPDQNIDDNFSVQTEVIESSEKYKYIQVEIENKHGFKDFTCLYRFYFWEQ